MTSYFLAKYVHICTIIMWVGAFVADIVLYIARRKATSWAEAATIARLSTKLDLWVQLPGMLLAPVTGVYMMFVRYEQTQILENWIHYKLLFFLLAMTAGVGILAMQAVITKNYDVGETDETRAKITRLTNGLMGAGSLTLVFLLTLFYFAVFKPL